MFTIIVEIPRSAPRAPIPAVCRFALSRLSLVRPFICVNSNYVERLSAVSAQTRMLLPLEDEINARPINSTLPSSLSPSSLLPVSQPRHLPRCRSTPLPFHLCRMILLDYTITAGRLCLTFGSARKWDSRLPTSSDLCYVRDGILLLVHRTVLLWIRLLIITKVR